MPSPTLVLLPALHKPQIEVERSPARYRVIAAGRRWGKGVLGIGEQVRRASLGKRCWWVAPSFSSAAYQAGWRMLEFYAKRVPKCRLHLQRRALVMDSGGWVQFKTAEEPDSLRGESIDFVVIDEAAHIAALQTIWELCLRSCLIDTKGEAWFISTPKGFNYFYTLFQKGGVDPKWQSFQYSSHTNPFLDRDELQDLTKDMPALVKRQEIDAEFVQLAGALFRRDNILILEKAPAGVRWVRSWDLAWTEKTTSDYTAGSKLGMAPDGTIVIAHMIRDRMEWPEAVRCIASTAQIDTRGVRQGIEVVGAQEAALQTLLRDPLLASYSFEPIRVTKDKLTRALPLIARSEQRKFAIVRGPWNQAYIDELCAFPDGQHDDQVDATSGGLTMIETPTGAWTLADIPKADPDQQQSEPVDSSAYEADLSIN